MKKIYIINGAAGVGKDTFVEIVRSVLSKTTDLDTYNISSVDNVKIAAKILGWDNKKDEKGRKFLSDLKDLSTINYKGPYQYLFYETMAIHKGFIFLHTREPEEIGYFVKNYPAKVKTILITRDSVETFTNHADQNVANYNYDIIIDNSGTFDELTQAIKQFIEKELES